MGDAKLNCVNFLIIWHYFLRADISFGVIHGGAKRPRAARGSEVVNNSAVGEKSADGRLASTRSLSRTLKKQFPISNVRIDDVE